MEDSLLSRLFLGGLGGAFFSIVANVAMSSIGRRVTAQAVRLRTSSIGTAFRIRTPIETVSASLAAGLIADVSSEGSEGGLSDNGVDWSIADITCIFPSSSTVEYSVSRAEGEEEEE